MRLVLIFTILISASVQSFAASNSTDCDQRNAEYLVMLNGIDQAKLNFEKNQDAYVDHMYKRHYKCGSEKLLAILRNLEAYMQKITDVYHTVDVNYCEQYKFTEIKSLAAVLLPDAMRIYNQWNEEVTPILTLVELSDPKDRKTCAELEPVFEKK